MTCDQWKCLSIRRIHDLIFFCQLIGGAEVEDRGGEQRREIVGVLSAWLVQERGLDTLAVAFEDSEHGIYDALVELVPVQRFQFGAGCGGADRGPVGPIAGHRLVGVSYCGALGLERDQCARESMWISVAVGPLVVGANPRADVSETRMRASCGNL